MDGYCYYLATWRDACSRRVVGKHLAAQIYNIMIVNVLYQNMILQQPAPGLVIHTDRGSQHRYTSLAYRQRIADVETLASYARPGNPYDNAQAEASWSTLNIELLPHGGAFANLKDARLEVACYLDT